MDWRRFSRRRFVQLLASGAGAITLPPRLASPRQAQGQAAKKTRLAPYSIELNLQANSNRNAGFDHEPGSLQDNTGRPLSWPVTIVWWPEHRQAMLPQAHFVTPPAIGGRVRQTLCVTKPADLFPHSHLHAVETYCGTFAMLAAGVGGVKEKRKA